MEGWTMMDMKRYRDNLEALDGGQCDNFAHTVVMLFVTWLELQEYTLADGLAHMVEYSTWLERWGIPERGIQRQVEFLRERGRLALGATNGTD